MSQCLENLQRLRQKSARLNDAGNLVARTRNILSVYATLVDTMDQIASVNMIVALKDASSLHQHAERVLSASLLIEELRMSMVLTIESITTHTENERLRTRQLIDDSLRIDIVAHCVAEIPHMQDALLEQVENVLMCGLRSLSPPLLGNALQSALHLKFLGPVVQNFLEDLNDVLLERMRTVLDPLALGKELGETQPPILPSHLKAHPSEQHTFPSSLPRWTNAIWERLKTFMVDELGSIMIKVKMLERILQCKYAPQSNGTLLDIVVSQLDNTPTWLLWSTFANNLEQLVHECIQESDFWWYIFVLSYPKFADLFNMLMTHLAIESNDSMASKLPEPMEKMLSIREKDYHDMLAQIWLMLSQKVQKATLEGKSQSSEAMTQFVTQLKGEVDICKDQAPLQLRMFTAAAEYLDSLLNGIKASIKKGDEAWSFSNKQLTAQQEQNMYLGETLKALHTALSEWNALYQENIETKLVQWRMAVVSLMRDDLLLPLVNKIKEETSVSLARLHQSKEIILSEAYTPSTRVMEAAPYMLDFLSRFNFTQTQLLNSYILQGGRIKWYVYITHNQGYRSCYIYISRVLDACYASSIQIRSFQTSNHLGYDGTGIRSVGFPVARNQGVKFGTSIPGGLWYHLSSVTKLLYINFAARVCLERT